MADKIISYDLGTSGCKASLYDIQGLCLASTTKGYQTLYPRPDWHEQRPDEWWAAVCDATRALLKNSSCKASDLAGLAISGHSLGAIPVDRDGRLLRDTVPLWSDRRALKQTEDFFLKVTVKEWYEKTGNGFARECYPIFKTIWYRENEPEIFDRCKHILGTKDYINYLLTGRMATDYSYASGSGLYNLADRSYDSDLIKASGLPASLWPEAFASSEIIGTVHSAAAAASGLPEGLPVCAGGVDNSCMALGAGNLEDGHVYMSLGSSAWIAVSSKQPVLDYKCRPFVFDHVVPGLYTSATSIFSAGSSLNWFVKTICPDLLADAQNKGYNVFARVSELAMEAEFPVESLVFNPTLAGGGEGDIRSRISGSFTSLGLGTGREQMMRAVLEGIAMDLFIRYRELKGLTSLAESLTIVGGGSKDALWMQMFADIFAVTVVKSAVDEDAGSLGAAAAAAVGTGLWSDYSKVAELNKTEREFNPDVSKADFYARRLKKFKGTLRE